jgi:hypothetical protein
MNLRHNAREVSMRSRQLRLAVFVVLGIMLCCASCRKEAGSKPGAGAGEAAPLAAVDSLYGDLLIKHLRAYFDDIHDVAMRFHHQDAGLNGMVELKVKWENGVLTGAEVMKNETGSNDLADALIEKMRGWEIAGLDGPFETVIPINVKIVGLDDPEFANTGILTGDIHDPEGNPLRGVMVVIKPQVAGMVYRAETNREGIFVRTLIPPGTWDVDYSLQGYKDAHTTGIELSAGKHVRESVVLEKR